MCFHEIPGSPVSIPGMGAIGDSVLICKDKGYYAIWENIDVCISNICHNGVCDGYPTDEIPKQCDSHSYPYCSGNNLFWFDSCGKKEELFKICPESSICIQNSCVQFNRDNPPVTIQPVNAPSVVVQPVTLPPISTPEVTVTPVTLPPITIPPTDSCLANEDCNSNEICTGNSCSILHCDNNTLANNHSCESKSYLMAIILICMAGTVLLIVIRNSKRNVKINL